MAKTCLFHNISNEIKKSKLFLQNEILSIDHGPNIVINLNLFTLTSHFIMYSLLVPFWTFFAFRSVIDSTRIKKPVCMI